MKHRWFIPLYIMAAIGVLFYLYKLYQTDPAAGTEAFARCPVEWSTGLKCPGCGSQRAVHQLMHGNIEKAFEWNAMLVASIPYLLFSLIPSKPTWLKVIYTSATPGWIVLALVLIFTIVRNTELYPLY